MHWIFLNVKFLGVIQNNWIIDMHLNAYLCSNGDYLTQYK